MIVVVIFSVSSGKWTRSRRNMVFYFIFKELSLR